MLASLSLWLGVSFSGKQGMDGRRPNGKTTVAAEEIAKTRKSENAKSGSPTQSFLVVSSMGTWAILGGSG